jgi:hypothetical protein
MIRLELQFPIVMRLLVYAGIPVLLLGSVVLAWGELLLLPGFRMLDSQAKLSVFLLPFLVAFFIYVLLQVIRARHALTTTYVFTEDGISIRAPHQAATDVPWREIQSGTYQRLANLLTLHSQQLENPVVLMNGRYPPTDWFAARSLVASKLGTRLENKWF